MDDCVFCKIIRHEIPAEIIYEDAETTVILSTRPDAPGHALVMPKKHVRNLFDMDTASFEPILASTQKIARALRDGLGAEGVNLIMNNEAPAGQVVFHYHMHVIPRRSGDGLKYGGLPGSYKEGEAKEVSEKIRATLS